MTQPGTNAVAGVQASQENKMKAVAVRGMGQAASEFPEVLVLPEEQGVRVRAIEVPRLLVVAELLRMRREVLLVDVDSVFLRSPLNSIRKDGLYPAADIAVSSECLSWENNEQAMKATLTPGMLTDRFSYSTPRANEAYGTIYTSSFSTGASLHHARLSSQGISLHHARLSSQGASHTLPG